MTEGQPEGQQTRAGPAARVAVAAVIVLSIIGAAWLMIELTRFWMLIFASLVLAMIFDAMARKVMALVPVNRPVALGFSVVLLLAVVIGVLVFFGTQLAGQFETISQSIPPALSEVEGLLSRFGLSDAARSVVDQGTSDLSRLLSQASGYVLAATSGLADFVLVFVGAIFIASDPAVYRRGLLLLMPRKAEQPVSAALDDASNGLRGWMAGQAVSSVVVAALTWGGLYLLGVPASGGLGLIAGMLDVIPMIGPIIAGVPAVLLAFTVSPATALWTVGLFLLVQQLQGNFLQPMIQKHAVNVPPAVLLFAVVAAGILFGLLGVLLAAPLTVVTFVLVQRIYVRTLLGKDIEVAGRN